MLILHGGALLGYSLKEKITEGPAQPHEGILKPRVELSLSLNKQIRKSLAHFAEGYPKAHIGIE